jgi:secretion/DNA translocation related TadE-like protein
MRARGESGAGSVLALAIVGAVVLLAVAALTLGSALVVRQKAIDAADAASLAAADAASGAVGGDPCAIARRVAAADGGALGTCRVDGLIVTVSVSARAGPFPVSAWSTAGPPP